MKKNPDHWREIADLINREKKNALDDFHLREFAPERRTVRKAMSLFSYWPGMRQRVAVMAASLLLVCGLVFFSLRSVSWRGVPTAPAWEQVLVDSLLYSQAGISAKETSVLPLIPASNPLFTAWAKVGLTIDPVGVAADPSASVEHGDPEEVRRRIGRAIQTGTFERLLSYWQEFHKKEA